MLYLPSSLTSVSGELSSTSELYLPLITIDNKAKTVVGSEVLRVLLHELDSCRPKGSDGFLILGKRHHEAIFLLILTHKREGVISVRFMSTENSKL